MNMIWHLLNFSQTQVVRHDRIMEQESHSPELLERHYQPKETHTDKRIPRSI